MPKSVLPEMLWHYTDAQGLLGILQSQQFWASSATYLNDDQELDYGHFCLRESLGKAAKRLDSAASAPVDEPSSLPGDFLRLQIAQLNGSALPLHGSSIPEISDIYIVSFCEEGDLLSQWLGYSEGSGYALGFDRKELIKSIAKNGLGMRLEKVLYGEEGVDMFDAFIQNHISNKNVQDSYIEIDDMQSLLQEIGWCKHPAFKAEQEWRLKIDDPLKVEVRSRGNDLLPYVKVDFPLAALKEVRIGPGGSRDLREAALKHALEAEGLKVFDCDLSDFETHASNISAMSGAKDAEGNDLFTFEDLQYEQKKMKREKRKAIITAEKNSDVKISRSEAPYRP